MSRTRASMRAISLCCANLCRSLNALVLPCNSQIYLFIDSVRLPRPPSYCTPQRSVAERYRVRQARRAVRRSQDDLCAASASDLLDLVERTSICFEKRQLRVVSHQSVDR